MGTINSKRNCIDPTLSIFYLSTAVIQENILKKIILFNFFTLFPAKRPYDCKKSSFNMYCHYHMRNYKYICFKSLVMQFPSRGATYHAKTLIMIHV